VVKLYNKYHKDGFDVFSVSLDKDQAKWVQAIESDGLVWPSHVSDLKYWQSEAAQLYNVKSIPFTVLLDREGKVIGTKLRGPQLEAKLKEIFGY
jgi:thioredoxin-related protein